MRKHLISLLLIAFSFCVTPFSFGTITLAPLASGFSLPVDIANAGDGTPRLFIAEQGGRIRIIQNGFVLATPFLNLTSPTSLVATGGEMGLLGLAFHPNYATNGQFFVYFTGTTASGVGANGDIVIARYQRSADPNVADATSRLNIITIPHRKGAQNFDNHNGGGLRFGPDGYLYASVGDGGSGGDPFGSGQDRKVLLGKIIRLDVDGASPYIPPSNPYAGSTCATTCPEIWAYGVRNPWRISFDRANGDFYIGDVGQGDWEEVNRQVGGASGGANYGWSVCEGNHRYPPANPAVACVPPNAAYVAPLLEYSHNSMAVINGLSITGGYVYRGQSTPDLLGRYVFGDFSLSKLWYTPVSPVSITQITGLSPAPQVSTFGESEAGELYMANYSNGTIYSFSSGTDMTPDLVAFTPVTNAPIGMPVTSHIVKLTGLGAGTPISISGAGGSYAVGTANATNCAGSFTSSAGVIAADSTLCVRHTSAATGNTARTTTLTIGTSQITFVSTTGLPVFSVNPIIGSNGSMSPNTVQQVPQNQTVTFTVTPNPGFMAVMAGSCGGTLTGNSYTTQPIVAHCDVIATFALITYAVTPSAGANGTIAPATVQNINQGATATFTVTPNPGYSSSVVGTCGGSLVGNTYTTNAINAPCTVAAVFALLPPAAPVIGTAVAGDALASVSFSASLSGGAAASYTATCGGVSAVGSQSPIVITGLANGMLYSCSVTATNSAGTGPASATVDVTPNALAPLTLITVQSRKLHNAVPRDLRIDQSQLVTGSVSVEPRMIASGHRIVFQFNVPVNDVTGVAAEDAAGAPYAGITRTIAGNEVIVLLTGIADNRRARVMLSGVLANNASSSPAIEASVGFLVGDVNHSRNVNASDISSVKARASPTVDQSNFRFDLNVSAAIDGADLSAAKARSGITLP